MKPRLITLRYPLLWYETTTDHPPILSTQWWIYGWSPSDTLYSVMNPWPIARRYYLLSDEPTTDHPPIFSTQIWNHGRSTSDTLYSMMNLWLITLRYSLLRDEPTADHPPVLSTQWWVESTGVWTTVGYRRWGSMISYCISISIQSLFCIGNKSIQLSNTLIYQNIFRFVRSLSTVGMLKNIYKLYEG